MKRIVVGRIGRPHGIRGDVTVELRTDDPETHFAVGAELTTDPTETGPLTVVSTGRSGHITLVHFVGVDDRNAAEQLRDTLLTVDADELASLPDDEYYDHQLVGLSAVGRSGEVLGTVTSVLHAPAAPVLTVRRPSGDDELVPFVSAIVPIVDLTAGTLTIDPPHGMFA